MTARENYLCTGGILDESLETCRPSPITGLLSRRQFLRRAAFAVAGAGLSACTPPSLLRTASPSIDYQEAVPSRETVQLVYQDWNSDWFPGVAQEMLAHFHEQYPHIRVFFTPDPPNVEESMLANMMAGTAPDLFQGCCTFFPLWAELGFTLDLQPYVDARLDQSTQDEWNPAQVAALVMSNDHRFALPKYHGSLALYYNRDLFDQLQIPYPDDTWDHDDYLQAMLSITQERSADGSPELKGSMIDISWDRIQVHVNGWDGHLIDPDDVSACALSSPQTREALEWIRARMWDDRVMATRLDVHNMSTRSAFINQHVAMIEDGSWALKDIMSNATFRIGVAPFPKGPTRRVTLATTDGYGIYAHTQHPDESWNLMEFLISEEYGRAMAQANFLQPARKSLVDDWIEMVKAQFPERSQGVDLDAFAHGHRHGYSVTIEIGPQMAELKRRAENAWEQILTLGQKPVESIAEVCNRFSTSGDLTVGLKE